MNETSTAPRASAHRPSRGGRLTRLVAVLLVASAIGALSSVVTAAIAVSSFFESRKLRAQLEETRIGIPTSLSSPSTPATAATPSLPTVPPVSASGERPRLDHSAWDALSPTKPIEIDAAWFGDPSNDFMNSARIVPSFKDGVAQGFKLFAIRPDSFYARLGLLNGDTVRRINGFEITTPERGLELYAQLKDAKELRVDIERRGTPMRLDFVVSNAAR
jgi:hypothetical protein